MVWISALHALILSVSVHVALLVSGVASVVAVMSMETNVVALVNILAVAGARTEWMVFLGAMV